MSLLRKTKTRNFGRRKQDRMFAVTSSWGTPRTLSRLGSEKSSFTLSSTSMSGQS